MSARDAIAFNNLVVIGILLGFAFQVLSREEEKTQLGSQFSNLLELFFDHEGAQSSRQRLAHLNQAPAIVVSLLANGPSNGRNWRQKHPGPKFGLNSAGPVIRGFPNGLRGATLDGVEITLSSPLRLDGEMGTIPGIAGTDYPAYASVPKTHFDCKYMEFPGLYSDTEAKCQVFHLCHPNEETHSFLCPNGTLFNQQYFVCDWWYNVDCKAQPYFYGLNEFNIHRM